jgi:hypothetical protein
MAEIMEAEIHNSHSFASPPKAVINPVIGMSITVTEEKKAFHMSRECPQGISQKRVDRDGPPLIVLGFRERDGPLAKIDISLAEGKNLPSAHPGMDGHEHNRLEMGGTGNHMCFSKATSLLTVAGFTVSRRRALYSSIVLPLPPAHVGFL